MVNEEVGLDDVFYVDKSQIHGLGLYAKTSIEEGSYLGTYDGPSIEDEEDNDTHVLWVEDDDGSWIGRDGKNILRYLNHSSTAPSCEFDGFDLYALRDIEPHEEVTFDYGEEPDGA